MATTKKATKTVSQEDAALARVKGLAWSWANHAAEIYCEDPSQYADHENGAELCFDCCFETLAGDAIRSGEITKGMVGAIYGRSLREFKEMDLGGDE